MHQNFSAMTRQQLERYCAQNEHTVLAAPALQQNLTDLRAQLEAAHKAVGGQAEKLGQAKRARQDAEAELAELKTKLATAEAELAKLRKPRAS